MNKKLLLITSSLLGVTLALQGVNIFTDFSGSTGNINLPYVDANDNTNNGNRTVARNQFTWTQSDPDKLSLAGLDTLTIGAFSWGTSATPISAGRIFTTLAGGQWNTDTAGAGTNSNIRATGTTVAGNARVQFNTSSVGTTAAAPADVAVWNLLFTVGSGGIPGLDFSFRAGTSNTNGTWRSRDDHGVYNIRITPVTVTGTTGVAQLGSSVSVFASPQEIGGGEGPTLTSTFSNTLAAGTYLLQLEFSGADENQRYGLGDFSMTAIPEPSTYALLAGLAVLGLVGLRRRFAR